MPQRTLQVGVAEWVLRIQKCPRDEPGAGERQTLLVGQSCPARVIVPPGVVHAYRCLGPGPGLVLNLPDRLYAGWGKRRWMQSGTRTRPSVPTRWTDSYG